MLAAWDVEVGVVLSGGGKWSEQGEEEDEFQTDEKTPHH
jgi:hypothetical protein